VNQSAFIYFLIAAFSLCVLKSYLTYHHRESELYFYATIPISISMAFVWSRYSRLCPDNSTMFWMAVVWDLITMSAYNILPILFFNVRFSPIQWVGVGMEKVYKPLISAAVEKRMNKAIKSGKFEQSKAYPDQLDNRDKIGQGKKESYCSSRDRRKGTCEDSADNDFFNQTVIEYTAACIAGGAIEGIRGFRTGGLAGALAGAGWGCAGSLASVAAAKSSEMEDEPGDGRRK